MSELNLPSDRSFGVTFAIVFGIVAAGLLWSANASWPWFAGGAALFFVLAHVRPRALRPLNALWMRLGALLNRAVSPIVLGAMYFGVLTPVALFFRLVGRDALQRKFDRSAATYWIDRQPPGPDGPSSFPRQF